MAKKSYATRALGSYRITSIYDGFAMAPSATYVTAEDRPSLSNEWRVFLRTGKLLMRADVLMFLVDTGREKLLIDAGAGKAIGPTMGAGRKNLIAAGFDPREITKILITHPHPDHLCGIAAHGEMAYPNARVFIDGGDFAHWTAPEHTYRQLGEALAPYLDAQRVVLFSPGDPLAEGVSPVALPGHTVGHTGYEVESDGERALFWGDIIHDYRYQLAYPDSTLVLRDFDAVRVAGEVRMQQTLLADVSASGRLVIAPHAPFPGVGRVVAQDDGTYHWDPLP